MAKHQECISSIIDKMGAEEKGMLKCVLLYGKEVQYEAGSIIGSHDELKEYGEDVTVDWVSTQLNEIFTEGIGFMDAVKDIYGDYGKQLDITINKVLVKSLNVTKPMFSKEADTVEGAIQREGWITEKLMDSLITNMDEDAKKEMANQVGKLLKEKGIDPGKAVQGSVAIITGGLAAARAIMGFNFIKVTAEIFRTFMFKTFIRISFQPAKFLNLLFGPIGWIITAITALPLITSLINPRGYDKFIPAVFILGVTRLSQNSVE